MDLIEREEPLEIARDMTQSLGIVWCSLKGDAREARDPVKWIANIEEDHDRRLRGQSKLHHFFIDKKGNIYEGVGWGAKTLHAAGKNQDFPHGRDNSISVCFLGPGEEFTPEAANAGRQIIEEHIERYGRRCSNILHRQMNTNSHSGGFKIDDPEVLTLADWVDGGCPPIEIESKRRVAKRKQVTVAEEDTEEENPEESSDPTEA